MTSDTEPTEPTEPSRPGRIRRIRGAVGGRTSRIRGALGGISRRLAEGVPVGFVAALAALVLIAILFTVATREPEKLRGYTELTLFPGACVIDSSRELNAIACTSIGPRTYRVAFSKPVDGSTPIASRGSCCPGSIGATADTDRTVVIALDRRVKRSKPVRVSLLIP